MKRTDIAIEALNISEEKAEAVNGILIENEEKNNIKITRLSVRSEEGAKRTGKPEGEYITIDAPDIKYDNNTYEEVCKSISKEIKRLFDFKNDSVILTVGLGNRDITPDALGCKAVSKIMVTNHIKKQAPELLKKGMRAVCAVSPGVLGTTGMESVDIVKGIVQRLKPELVIVIDALAAADFSRISTTFQISDAGIAPGSGIGNNRAEFNEKSLGTRVIAIGVPTVVDARSVCECTAEGEELMVTPRDIDLIIERCSKAIANGINLALHENIALEDIEEYVG